MKNLVRAEMEISNPKCVLITLLATAQPKREAHIAVTKDQ